MRWSHSSADHFYLCGRVEDRLEKDMAPESLTFGSVHLMAVKPTEGLCSPGQGHRADRAFLPGGGGAAASLPERASQAAAHQVLKDLHCGKNAWNFTHENTQISPS